MIFKKILFLSLLSIILLSCNNKEERKNINASIKDDLGNNISFDKIPNRIITLAPNLTEIIYDLGLEKYLVGNTLYCNYPEAARKIEKVGDMLTFEFEKIVTLKPDVVFITVEGNTKQTYDKFLELGIKIFANNPRNYDGIKKTYSDLGRIFKIENFVKSKVAKWDSITTKISASSKNFPQKTAMFVIDLKPVMLAGKNTFINQYLELCGLKNIAEDSPLNYPMYSREEILKRNPDYIIYPTGGNDNISKIKNAYPEWAQLKAIRNNNVIFIDRDLYLRPGSRFAEAVEDLFNRLHH
jgi:iron complex transport system substrate-binding protein